MRYDEEDEKGRMMKDRRPSPLILGSPPRHSATLHAHESSKTLTFYRYHWRWRGNSKEKLGNRPKRRSELLLQDA